MNHQIPLLAFTLAACGGMPPDSPPAHLDAGPVHEPTQDAGQVADGGQPDSGPLGCSQEGELGRFVLVTDLEVRFIEIEWFGAPGCPAGCSLGSRRTIVAAKGEVYELLIPAAESFQVRLVSFDGDLLGAACGRSPAFDL